MAQLAAFNLMGWIDAHRDILKPPVGNAQVWKDADFIIMIVGGPNVRTDYHVDPLEEFFYQLTANMTLRIIEDGRPRDVAINQGDVLLLPPNVPHSPQRPEAEGYGLVVERTRPVGLRDAFEWYCENCHRKVHRREVQLRDIVTDLPPVFDEYYGDAKFRMCPGCGHENPGRPAR